jgi:hypothetical protein
MAEKLSLQIEINGQEKVINNVRELRKAIKEAEFDAFALSEQFGESDPRVVKIREEVGKLKNSMADATDQAKAFSEDSKFPAVAKSIQGIASGFTAVQGAMALIGVESESVEKTLLKVNSAMALSQGLAGMIESIDSFKILNSLTKTSSTLKTIDIGLTKAASAAQLFFTGAVNTTATSFNALKVAIASTGIGALVVAVGFLVTKMIEWANSTEDVEKETKKLNEQLEINNKLTDESLKSIDYVTKMQLANARKRGASAKELSKIESDADAERLKALKDNFNNQSAVVDGLRKKKVQNVEDVKAAEKSLTDAQAAYNNELLSQQAKRLEKEADVAEDARNKATDAENKRREKKKADNEKEKQEREDAIKEAQQVELDAFKATLSEQEREEFESGLRLAENRAKLQKAGISDFKAIEEQYQIELAEIRKKYADEQEKKDKEVADKNKENWQKLIEDRRGAEQVALQQRIDNLDRENDLVDGDFEQDLERLQQKRIILDELEKSELANTQLTEFERTQIRAKYAKERSDVTQQEVQTERDAQDAKVELNNQYLDILGNFGGLLQQIAGKNKALAISGVVVEQIAGISRIISNTAVANAKSVAASPLTAGMPFVAINNVSAGLSIASSIASAAKAIAQIKSQGGAPVSGGTLSSDSIKSGGGAPVSPQASMPMETTLNQSSINALGNQAIKAYVIESDMTSNQQRIAAIRQRARFS